MTPAIRKNCHLTRVSIAALVFAFAAPARAEQETLFKWLGLVDDPPAIGVWQTTIARTTLSETVAVSSARTLSTPPWTTIGVASSTSQITTGSIGDAKPASTLPGPRLTGTQHALSGKASFYHEDQMTATGERFDKNALTAAHKTLPFGTRVRVTRADTGKNVIVRINDRGPYKGGRIIDLSEAAAKHIGMTAIGIAQVTLEILGR